MRPDPQTDTATFLIKPHLCMKIKRQPPGLKNEDDTKKCSSSNGHLRLDVQKMVLVSAANFPVHA